MSPEALRNELSFSLSLSQKQILQDQQVWPDSPHFNVGGIGNIEGDLDLDIYVQAIRVLTQKHPILLQEYFSASERLLNIPDNELLERVDVSTAPDPGEESKQICRDMFSRPVSLNGGNKLWQMKLIKLAPKHYLMVAKFHHLVMDGFSVALAFRELGLAYNELLHAQESIDAAVAQPQPIHYGQFIQDSVAYQASELWDKDARFWRQYITHRQDFIFNQQHRILKKHWQAEGVSLHEAIHHFEIISPTRYEELDVFCSEFKSSVYHLYATAIAVYFAGVAGLEELVIGVPVLNRSGKKYKATLGMFAHLVPLKITLTPGISAGELIRTVNKRLRECYRHARYPLGEIIRQIPGEGTGQGPVSNVFDIILSYELHDFSVEFGEASLRRIQRHFSSVARYPFTFCICEFHKDDPREIAIEASKGIFTADEVRSISQRINHILSQIIRNPDISVEQLALMTPQESESLHKMSVSGTQCSPVINTVFDEFEGQVKQHPNKVAIKTASDAWTYATVYQKVLDLASGLMALGINQGAVVALNLPRQPDTLVCMLAVMKVRGIYLLLDPESSAVDLDILLKQSRAVLMVMNADDGQSDIHNVKVITPMGLLKKGLESPRVASENSKPALQDPAYILFTSGSTGMPKGVIVNHTALAVRIHWLQKELMFTPDDVFLQSIALTFDPAHIEIFLPLTSGACCALAPHGPVAPASYLSLIRMFSATAIIFVPTSLKYFLRQIDKQQKTSLRVVISGGEQLYQEQAEALVKATGVRLYNLYGPTEACIFASYFRYQRGLTTEHVPIGTPVDNTSLYVLDKYMRLLPQGSIGELYIGGQGIAVGYLDEEHTQTSFVDNPFAVHAAADTLVFDGDSQRLYKTGDLVYVDERQQLCFVSRVDTQIKHHGVRIEPENVEHDLLRTGLFRNTAVQLHEGRLCAWLELLSSNLKCENQPFSHNETLDTIIKHLPAKHLPECFYIAKHIPQTNTGKVDYTKLSDISCIPLTWSEQNDAVDADILDWLTKAWTRITGNTPRDMHQPFTEFGGDSLAALNMIAEIEAKYARRLPLNFLVKHNTINRLALAIMVKTTEPCQNLSGHERGKRIYCIAAGFGDALKVKALAHAMGDSAHLLLLQPGEVKNISANNKTKDNRVQEISVHEIATTYLKQIIRNDTQEGGEAYTGSGSRTALIIAGYSIGGTIALETARLAKQQSMHVEKLILIDSIYPHWLLRNTPLWSVLKKLAALMARQISDPKQKTRRTGWTTDIALDHQMRALKKYRPEFLDIEAVLLVSDVMDVWRPLLMRAWEGLFLRLDRQRIPGSHDTLWHDENLVHLANTLKRICG